MKSTHRWDYVLSSSIDQVEVLGTS